MAAGDIAREAQALKRRHSDLLAAFARCEVGPCDAQSAADAIDAARARLQGEEPPARDQLALDLWR